MLECTQKCAHLPINTAVFYFTSDDNGCIITNNSGHYKKSTSTLTYAFILEDWDCACIRNHDNNMHNI